MRSHPSETRYKQFRESLDMTQQEFGQHFGDYDQKQISSYERGQVELPLALLLNIRTQGYPLEAILGAGSTTVLDDTIAYLSASHRDHAVARQLADTMLQLLNRNVTGIERVLREFDRPPQPITGVRKPFSTRLPPSRKLCRNPSRSSPPQDSIGDVAATRVPCAVHIHISCSVDRAIFVTTSSGLLRAADDAS